jgi:hypothetical protein
MIAVAGSLLALIASTGLLVATLRLRPAARTHPRHREG